MSRVYIYILYIYASYAGVRTGFRCWTGSGNETYFDVPAPFDMWWLEARERELASSIRFFMETDKQWRKGLDENPKHGEDEERARRGGGGEKG